MNGMRRWELRGVGDADPRMIGDAAVHVDAEGTVVIGTWVQAQLVEVMDVLTTSGFEVLSIRRLDAYPLPA